jgi:hypothetical protein
MKQYKYVPIAEIVSISKKASHLESIGYYQDRLNQEAKQGWNFVGTERLSSQYNPGCWNEFLLKIPIVSSFVRSAESVNIKMLIFEQGEEITSSIPIAKTALPLKVETLLFVESQNPPPIEKLVSENSISKDESITSPASQTESKSFFQNPDLLKKVGIGIGIFVLLLLSFKFVSYFVDRSSSSSGIYSGSRIGIVNDKAGIRFRSGPGVQHSKIGFFYYGTKFKVLDTNGPEDYQNNAAGRWYKVEYEGQVGWVFGAFVGLE